MTDRATRILVDSPKPIREQVLRPDRLMDLLAEIDGDVVAGMTPGTGKTTSVVELVRSGVWREHGFQQIIIVNPSRRVLNQTYTNIMRKPTPSSLSVMVYPSAEDPRHAPCAPDNAELLELLNRGMSVYAASTICRGCTLRDGCAFVRRHQRKQFQDADVVLICGAPLRFEPRFIEHLLRVADDGQPAKVLVIDDEAVGVRSGFISTITEDEILREREIALMIRRATDDEGTRDLIDDAFDALDHLLQHPHARWRQPIPAIRRVALRWQRLGSEMWPDYHYRLPLAMAYLSSPCWYENGVYAVTRFPWLPKPTLFLGALLDSDLLRWRYGRTHVTDLLPGVVVRHPETRTVVNRSSAFTPSNWSGNANTNGAFIADLLIREAALGRTVCLLTRKDKPKQPWATRTLHAVRQALHDRKASHIRLLEPAEELPEHPTVGVVPVITVGAVGVNSYEDYKTIIQAMAFYVPAEAIREMAFGDRPPSERPTFTLDGRRRPVWDTEPSAQDRQRVAMAIRIMEIDPIIQGLSRVRGAIHGRLLVACTQHDLSPWLGPVEVVRSTSMARVVLGLGSTVGNRMEQQVAALQARYAKGQTLREIAQQLDLNYATVRRLAKRCHLAVRRGRPASNVRTPTPSL